MQVVTLDFYMDAVGIFPNLEFTQEAVANKCRSGEWRARPRRAGSLSDAPPAPRRAQVTPLWAQFFICEMWRMETCGCGKVNTESTKPKRTCFPAKKGPPCPWATTCLHPCLCHWVPSCFNWQKQVRVRFPPSVGSSPPILGRSGHPSTLCGVLQPSTF